MNYGFILLALGLQVQVNGLTVNGFFSRFAPSRMTLLDSLIEVIARLGQASFPSRFPALNKVAHGIESCHLNSGTGYQHFDFLFEVHLVELAAS